MPVTILVLRNDEYMMLKWFAMREQVKRARGVELPGVHLAAVSGGSGMQAREVSGRERLIEALREAIAGDYGPSPRGVVSVS
jgi:benzoylformate decarboxylase